MRSTETDAAEAQEARARGSKHLTCRERIASAGSGLWGGLVSLVDGGGTRDAAQVAFFLLMSFPALLLLMAWGFSTVLSDESVRGQIVLAIVDVLPLADEAARARVEQLLDSVAAGAGALGWVAALALVYSASGAIGALRHTVNKAFGGPDTRPLVPGKALDAALTVVVAPTMIVGLGLNISGEVSAAIGDHPAIRAGAEFVVTDLLPVTILFLILAALFSVLPHSRARLREAAPGAAIGVLGILLISFGSEFYFSTLRQVNAVYGTLGILLAVVFSIYLAAIAVVYGAYVTAQAARPAARSFPDGRDARTGGRPEPILRMLLRWARGLFVRNTDEASR